MIHRPFPEAHMHAHRVMRGIDILSIPAHIAALDVIGIQVRRRHHDRVGVHFHHEGDNLLRPDVVRNNPRFCLRQFENLVLRVVGHVVDGQVAPLEEFHHNIAEVFPETAFFGIEHHMFVPHGEETFVVRLFPFRQRIPAQGEPLLLFAVQRFNLRQRRAALFKFFIVDMLLRRYCPVQQIHLEDGEQVACDPVEADARGYEKAQVQAQADGDDQHAVFVQFPLLRLERLVPVLRHGHDQRAERRENRNNDGNPALFGRHPAQVDSQEHQIPAVSPGNQVPDHLHKAQQEDQLDDNRQQPGQRIVLFLLVQFRLSFGNGVPVPVVIHMEPVDLRHHPDHFQSVAMHPDAQRQQDDL